MLSARNLVLLPQRSFQPNAASSLEHHRAGSTRSPAHEQCNTLTSLFLLQISLPPILVSDVLPKKAPYLCYVSCTSSILKYFIFIGILGEANPSGRTTALSFLQRSLSGSPFKPIYVVWPGLLLRRDGFTESEHICPSTDNYSL